MFPRTYFPPTYFAPTYFPGPSTAAPIPAGTLDLTGPTSGSTGIPSSNFSVQAASLRAADTVTPHSDTSGAFSPVSQAFAAGTSSHTFVYTPAADGIHVITLTDTLGADISGSPTSYASTTATPTPTPPGDLKIAIVAALAAQADAVALFAARVYPVVIPQSSPLGAATLTYQFQGSVHDTSLTAPAGMRYVEVLFRVSSFDHGEIESGREILRNLMQGYRTSLAGVPIVYVFFDDESDGYDEPISGADIGVHWKEIPFTFKLRETLPTNS